MNIIEDELFYTRYVVLHSFIWPKKKSYVTSLTNLTYLSLQIEKEKKKHCFSKIHDIIKRSQIRELSTSWWTRTNKCLRYKIS